MTDDPSETSGLSALDVSIAAGSSVELVHRLSGAGVIVEGADGFASSAVARVRMVVALETSGLSLDAIVEAVRSDAFPLDFIDDLMPDPVRLLPETHGQMLERLGIPFDLAEPMRTILESTGAHDGEQVREDDAAFFTLLASARALGADDEQLIRVVRTYADAVRRIVGAERDFIDEVLIGPAMEAGMNESQIMAATSAVRRDYRAAGVRLFNVLHQRFVDDAIFQNLTLHGERAAAAAGIADPRPESLEGIAFVDVSGFTRIAEEEGDDAAVEAAARFAELVQIATSSRGGRLVKLLGDGAMLYFPRAPEAIRCVLDLVERASSAPIPPLHVGVAAGHPVRRDGDYFGSVVNIASRAADHARPGEVLATEQVRDTWDASGVSFDLIGPFDLKNVFRPVQLFSVRRMADVDSGGI